MSITKLPKAYTYLKETRAFQKIVDSLTRGFRIVMKRDPDETEKFKIKREAIQKYQNERKVLDVKFGTPERDFGIKATKTRQMTADELEDFEMDIGDALEGYDFDGTVGSAERILKKQKAYEAAMYRDYKAGRLDPKPGEPNRKRFLEKKLEEMEMSGDKKLMTREEIEELSSFDLGTQMDEAIKKSKTLSLEDELRREFPGIDDNMIKNILADKNPQRIAEVKQTMREALEMGKKGMSPDEIIKMFKDTTRTKQASGGLAKILDL